MRIPLIYALHSGNLYGTERMALATVAGLLDEFSPVILAPPGPAVEEAQKRGYATHAFENPWQLAWAVRGVLARSRRVAFLATGVMHSAICLALNRVYRRRIAHLHLVHGGASEALSYGRKRKLNGNPVVFVAVSRYVRERLLAHQVNPDQIEVIENFLPDAQLASCPRRALFGERDSVRKLIVISRLDPEKRVGLLLDALAGDPASRAFDVQVFGTGWESEELRNRATAANLNIHFRGFQANVDECLAASDLLVHLCPVEPFGLAILESMAAGVPVLVPDAGGAGSLVEHGISGLKFRANDAEHLMERLREASNASPWFLNTLVAGGRELLATRFAEQARIADYRRLLTSNLN